MIRLSSFALVLLALVSSTSAKIDGTCEVNDVKNDACRQRCCAKDVPFAAWGQSCGCESDTDCTGAGIPNGKCCNSQCINSVTHACCEWKANPDDTEKTQQAYIQYSQKCCPRDGPKDWNEPCSCVDSTHCPNSHGLEETSCCKRSKLPSDDDDFTPPGTCHNPKVAKCCVTANKNQHPLITLDIDGDTSNENQCCAVDGIIGPNQRCSCAADGDCGSGDTCCYESNKNRLAWRRSLGWDVSGIISAEVLTPIQRWNNEYADKETEKCTRDCWNDMLGENQNTNCRGKCARKALDDTCCSDGSIASDSTTCCAVKPTRDNRDSFSSTFEVFVGYNHINQLCCPKGVHNNGRRYIMNIPTSCNTGNAGDRCYCDVDSDCPNGGSCCGNKCTLPSAKEKCCSGFSDEQEPIIIPEDRICCPLGPYAITEGQRCECGGDGHCPSGKTCCSGGNCYHNSERCTFNILAGNGAIGCYGQCIDPDHDTCCGYKGNSPVVCKTKFHKCCGENSENAVCCNKENQVCRKTKPLEGEPVSLCSVSIQPSHAIIFHAIVYPIILTFVLIAINLVAIAGAMKGAKMFTIVTVAFNVLTLLLSLLLLWSMLWKFSVVVVIANSAVLAVICAPHGSWSRRVAAVLAFIALLYVVDPFTGHSILSFHWTRLGGGNDNFQSGLQDAAKSSWLWGSGFGDYNDVDPIRCHSYYQWFRLDDDDWSVIRNVGQPIDHHQRYWGICSVGWIHAINIIAGLLVIFEILVTCLGLYLLTSSCSTEVENFDRPKSVSKIAPIQQVNDAPPIEDPARN